MTRWPDPVLRIALACYGVLMRLLRPAVWAYLRKRGRKDPDYISNLDERLGHLDCTLTNPVWVHAVSTGELRSAVPLIQALLAKGDHVVTTHFTPAGRREAERVFAKDIDEGRVVVTWVPYETKAAYRRFLAQVQPRYGLVMEIEVWPMMIWACHTAGLPLYMCNAQYPAKSYDKDQGGLGLRRRLFGGFAGGFVKSQMQADRLRDVGLSDIAITGELRFDQPIPPQQLQAADVARPIIAPNGRQVVTLASVVEGEDQTYIAAIKAVRGPLYVYVPRAPERFDETVEMLISAGLTVVRRSDVLDADLQVTGALDGIDVLVGDSMGEMYFYLGLCDRAIVGGGFVPKGAHNIIEPLALKKPVMVGPHIWTITYPAHEAIEAGVCTLCDTQQALIEELQSPAQITDAQISSFFEAHAGGTKKTMDAIAARGL